MWSSQNSELRTEKVGIFIDIDQCGNWEIMTYVLSGCHTWMNRNVLSQVEKFKYAHLVIDLLNIGFKVKVYASEIGCRGLICMHISTDMLCLALNLTK